MLGRKTAWATAVYFQKHLSLPPEGQPNLLLRSKKLFRGPRHIHTKADPFLFSDKGRLFLLYEVQAADDPGAIEAAEITLSGVRSIGTVLREPFHLSYPSVFRHLDGIYLLPECQASGAMRLYRFGEFPRRPIYVRTLREGSFADPSPVVIGDTLFIFATTSRGLELYFTNDLLSGELQAHPCNPITCDRRFSRCGGMPFLFDGTLVRPAQNCSGSYGANLSLMSVDVITRQAYRETPFQTDIFAKEHDWNSEGGHHVSVCPFRDGVAVAVDGQTFDYYVHKFITRGWMIATGNRSK